MFSVPALFWFRFTPRQLLASITLFFRLSPSFCKIALRDIAINFKISPISLDSILVRFLKAKSISYVCLRTRHFSDATAWRAHDLDPPKIAPNCCRHFFPTDKYRCHFNTGLHPLLWRPGLALTYYSSGLMSSRGLSLRMRAAACVATTPSRFEPRFFGDF